MRRYSLYYSDGRRVVGALRELKPLWCVDWEMDFPILETQSKRGARWTSLRGNGLAVSGWRRRASKLNHPFGYYGRVPIEWTNQREPLGELARFCTEIMMKSWS